MIPFSTAFQTVKAPKNDFAMMTAHNIIISIARNANDDIIMYLMLPLLFTSAREQRFIFSLMRIFIEVLCFRNSIRKWPCSGHVRDVLSELAIWFGPSAFSPFFLFSSSSLFFFSFPYVFFLFLSSSFVFSFLFLFTPLRHIYLRIFII